MYLVNHLAKLTLLIITSITLILSGCSSSSGGGSAAPVTDQSTYTVGGVVSGISVSGLKLTNNGGDELIISDAGTFVFNNALTDGNTYNVQISQSPTTPIQSCTLTNNSGTISGKNIADIYISCSALTLNIISISNTIPGQSPTVRFQVSKNNAPIDILLTPLTRLNATIAGPSTDYSETLQATIQGTGATGTLIAVDPATGTFDYTFPPARSIPALWTGSASISLDGYYQDDIALPRFIAESPVMAFTVTDASASHRRTIVDDKKCNACHTALIGHASYRGVQYCAFCHNPTATNSTRVARVEGATIIAPSMDFKVMIHKIHRGSGLTQQPYLLWSFPAPSSSNPQGTPVDYGIVNFMGDLKACETCHLPNTYDLPLAQNLLPSTETEHSCTEDPVADIDSYCNSFVATNTFTTLPETAACTSCHDAPYTAAHASTMTTSSNIESCATCHAIGSINGIDVYHTIGTP